MAVPPDVARALDLLARVEHDLILRGACCPRVSELAARVSEARTLILGLAVTQPHRVRPASNGLLLHVAIYKVLEEAGKVMRWLMENDTHIYIQRAHVRLNYIYG